MKLYFITIAFIFLFGAAHAQKVEGNDTTIYNAVDQEPKPVGGMKEFFKYLTSLHVPPIKSDHNINTKFKIEMTIEKDGSISNVKISPGAGDQNIAMIKASPKWNPGKLHGKPVRVRYTIPIIIELQMDDQ